MKKKKEEATHTLFKEIMAENFPVLGKEGGVGPGSTEPQTGGL